MRPGRVAALLAAMLVLAAGVHLAAVWALPRVVMRLVLDGVEREARMQPLLPSRADHHARRIVMPSPDLLYALCHYDLDRAALRVQADPSAAGFDGYWSIALYDDRSDNVHVVGDRDLARRPLQLLVTGPRPGGPVPAVHGDLRRVEAPAGRGLLLMRLLAPAGSPSAAAAEAARRTLRCEPAQVAAGG